MWNHRSRINLQQIIYRLIYRLMDWLFLSLHMETALNSCQFEVGGPLKYFVPEFLKWELSSGTYSFIHTILICLWRIAWLLYLKPSLQSAANWGVLHHLHSQAVNGFQSTLFATAKAQLIRITSFLCCLEIQLTERTVRFTSMTL